MAGLDLVMSSTAIRTEIYALTDEVIELLKDLQSVEKEIKQIIDRKQVYANIEAFKTLLQSASAFVNSIVVYIDKGHVGEAVIDDTLPEYGVDDIKIRELPDAYAQAIDTAERVVKLKDQLKTLTAGSTTRLMVEAECRDDIFELNHFLG